MTLCRELTKLNEEIIHTTFGDAVAYYENNEPRGEYVLVTEGYVPRSESSGETKLSVCEQVNAYIDAGMEKMEAIKTVAKERGLAKNVVYKEVADCQKSAKKQP